ncbi:hypothetical protein BH24CHL3_BH24CHL3_02030 [soil metagenome]
MAVGALEQRSKMIPGMGAVRVARGLGGMVKKLDLDAALKVEYADINGATGIVILVEGAVDQVYTFDVREGRIFTVRAMRGLNKWRHIDHALRGFSEAVVSS